MRFDLRLIIRKEKNKKDDKRKEKKQTREELILQKVAIEVVYLPASPGVKIVLIPPTKSASTTKNDEAIRLDCSFLFFLSPIHTKGTAVIHGLCV